MPTMALATCKVCTVDYSDHSMQKYKSDLRNIRYYSNVNLSNFAEATGVNRSVLSGNRHYVPSLILGLAPATPRRVWPTTAPSTLTRIFLRQQLLLDFDLLSVFLQLCLFMDLVNGLRTLISSPGNPVVLCDRIFEYS